MPSPIAHATIGMVIWRLFCRRRDPPGPERPALLRYLLLVTVGLSLLPDLDALAGMLLGDFARFHNNLAHSLLFGIVVALSVGSMVWLRSKTGFLRWSLISLLCYDLHVLMDYFTVGRGVMLLWPLSTERYSPPVSLFYGLHWSDGWLAPRHLWTFSTELAFTGLVLLLFHLQDVRGREV